MTSNKTEKGGPGPEPQRLKLDGDDWGEAVRKALRNKRKPPEDEPPGADKNGDEEPEYAG